MLFSFRDREFLEHLCVPFHLSVPSEMCNVINFYKPSLYFCNCLPGNKMTSVLFQSVEPPSHLCPFCSGFCQNGTSKKERRVNNCPIFHKSAIQQNSIFPKKWSAKLKTLILMCKSPLNTVRVNEVIITEVE